MVNQADDSTEARNSERHEPVGPRRHPHPPEQLPDVRSEAEPLTGLDDETAHERYDRNWIELLQELRVTQSGTQILTGFLLALAFQPAFKDLSSGQTTIYLCLVILAALSTVLGLAPVSLHRLLFRRGLKLEVVQFGNTVLIIALGVISLLVLGVVYFIVDIVVSELAAFVAFFAIAAVILLTWIVIPVVIRAKHRAPTSTPAR